MPRRRVSEKEIIILTQEYCKSPSPLSSQGLASEKSWSPQLRAPCMIMTPAPPLPPRRRPLCSPIGGARILATRRPSGIQGAELAQAQLRRRLSAAAGSGRATRAACTGFSVSYAPSPEPVPRHPLPSPCGGDRRGPRAWASAPLAAADSAAQDAKPPVRAAGSTPSPSPPLSPRMTLPAPPPP